MMPGEATTTVLLISGMRGNSCREQIAAALAAVAGVRTVNVNLYRARATVTHDPARGVSELIAAIIDAGYDASLPEEGAVTGHAGARAARGSRNREKRPGSTG